MEFFRSYTHNCHGVAIQPGTFADDLGIAVEVPLPVGVAKNQHWCGAGRLRFRRLNQTAQRRLNAQHREIISGDITDKDLVRTLIHSQPLEPERIGQHVREATGLSAIIAKIRVRQIVKLSRAFFARSQDHQAIRVLHRKRPQEQRVHDAENCRVRPNPYR